jgi:nitrate reductase delta subunit
MRPENHRPLFKLLSACLSYPDAALAAAVPELAAAAADVEDRRIGEPLAEFAAHLGAEPLLRLQEHYTAVFDLRPRASLNLTYHLMGDREERGRALAGLLALYRDDGFEPAVNELPDYLPLLLEFLSVAPQAMSDLRVSRCLAAVPALLEVIREHRSIYAAPLEVLGHLLAEPDAASRPNASEPPNAALEG